MTELDESQFEMLEVGTFRGRIVETKWRPRGGLFVYLEALEGTGLKFFIPSSMPTKARFFRSAPLGTFFEVQLDKVLYKHKRID